MGLVPTIEMILISSVFRFGLVADLYRLMRETSGCHRGTLLMMAADHLRSILRHGGDQNTVRFFSRSGREMGSGFPDFLNGWIIAGCPGIRLVELEKMIFDAVGSDAVGGIEAPTPAEFKIILQGFGKQEPFVAKVLQSGMTPRLLQALEAGSVPNGDESARIEPCFERLVTAATLHLRHISILQNQGDAVERDGSVVGIETPYLEYFKAWILEGCPGTSHLGMYNLEIDAKEMEIAI